MPEQTESLDSRVASRDASKITRVVAAARDVLAHHPNGLRFSELVRAVRLEVDFQNLANYIQWLPERNPELFTKPSRGLFMLTSNHVASLATVAEEVQPCIPAASASLSPGYNEASFYASFADYLVQELDECTRALVVGGNSLGSKWGTPDVIGVKLPRPRDMYKAPLEIVSVELKIVGDRELITAFGQACSYQLFSHKTYVVVPKTSKEAELDRLETLCQVFGIGLILIGKLDPANPEYSIRVRALRREPDSFYVNETLNTDLGDQLLGHSLA